MGFWGSLFGGQNKTLNTAIPQAGQASQFATNTGEGLINQSAGWLKGLMSGDASKVSALLAPQIGAAKERGQQGKATMAQFGTRSGGTAAAAANIDQATRSDITKATSDLTGQAISQGMSAGRGLLDSGMSFLNQQVQFSQDQVENWSNSILGRGITSAISSGESFALGKVPGMPSEGGDV